MKDERRERHIILAGTRQQGVNHLADNVFAELRLKPRVVTNQMVQMHFFESRPEIALPIHLWICSSMYYGRGPVGLVTSKIRIMKRDGVIEEIDYLCGDLSDIIADTEVWWQKQLNDYGL